MSTYDKMRFDVRHDLFWWIACSHESLEHFLSIAIATLRNKYDSPSPLCGTVGMIQGFLSLI